MKFTVWIVTWTGDHDAWRCLFEVAAGIRISLEKLGHTADLFAASEIPPEAGRLIVFNAHRLPPDLVLPDDAIIFNAEQVQLDGPTGEGWKVSSYLRRLKEHLVWDYCDENINRLHLLGVDRVVKCRVGYYPELTDIIPAEQQDVDVLFVGSLNERRVSILHSIASRKMTVRVLAGVYGKERNDWIARSKVVLNVHFYEKPIFEIFRVSHLLANKKCVVTEGGGRDFELEQLADDTCVREPYGDSLVKACLRMVHDADARRRQGDFGFRIFSGIDQTKELPEL